MAERTTKRIRALELQNAIKAQVEERERLRKLELEKSLLEERRIEENLRQQRESNEQRFEEEQRITREKFEREQRKQEMMRMAIEKARQEAELERSRKKRLSFATSECETPRPNEEQKLETPTVDDMRNKNRIEVSNSPIPIETDDAHDSEDDEKILIGTPIRMRKKTLNKGNKVPPSAKKEMQAKNEKESNGTVSANTIAAAAAATTSPAASAVGIPNSVPETNVDGIALVLQTLPPIMPILNNDIINLNQNINNLNTSNIQLAVMLAHQMQQLNSIAAQNQNQNQNPRTEILSNKINVSDNNGKNAVTEGETDVCKQCTGEISDRKDKSKAETEVNILENCSLFCF